MKTLGEFINDLATKAGIKSDNEDLVGLLSAPILQQLQVPEKIELGISNNLLSVEAAKNNHPALKSHYFAAAYDGLDREIDATMEELELSDELKLELKKERSSTKRAALLAKKIREIEKAASKDEKTPAELKDLKKQVDALHEQLRIEKENSGKVKSDYEGQIKGIRLNSSLEKLLSPHKTIYDDLDADIRSTSMMAIINKELQSSEGVLDLDENGNLKLLKKDGSNFFGENHVQLNPQGFVEKVLAKNKILKQSVVLPGKTDDEKNRGFNRVAGGDDNKVNHSLKSLAEQALADLERTPTQIQ